MGMSGPGGMSDHGQMGGTGKMGGPGGGMVGMMPIMGGIWVCSNF